MSAPSSYSSSLSHESRYGDDEWIEKITDPALHHLICQRTCYDGSGEDEWVGMLTFHGPLLKEGYSIMGRQGPELGDDSTESRWHLQSLYLKFEHRVRDAGIAIHEGVLDHLRSWTDDNLETRFDEASGVEKPKRARIGGTVRREMPAMGELYSALGGYEVGLVGRAEALRIAGNEKLIDLPETKVWEKDLLVMEKVIDC